MHPIAEERLRLVRSFDDNVFTRLESHDSYLFGEFSYPVAIGDLDEVGTVGIRIVVDFEQFLTVTRRPDATPPSLAMPDLDTLAGGAEDRIQRSGDCIWLLLEAIAEQLDHLLSEANRRTDDLEAILNESREPPAGTGQQIAKMRHVYLQLEGIITPTMRVVEKIVDDQLDLRDGEGKQARELFPRSTEIYLIDVLQHLHHAQNRTGYGRDMLSVLTDSLASHLERRQAQAGNRMGAIASIMLLPTFIVGLYGMNIDSGYFPEFGWLNGYLFAWLLILLITVSQWTFFRRRGWL